MAILDEAARKIIENHSLGFVASVNGDGTPNLSPKGMMLAIDDGHIVFGEVRSPGTVANIADRPTVEINFVDVLARKAVRVRGQAEIIEKETPAFLALRPHFDRWGALADRVRRFVRVRIETAKVITSPAYNIGATEEELRSRWKAYYRDQ
jgi:predicted pyridoxine 5'-phosphate oxidase superfamily flavin-nucleotide-binding protein